MRMLIPIVLLGCNAGVAVSEKVTNEDLDIVDLDSGQPDTEENIPDTGAPSDTEDTNTDTTDTENTTDTNDTEETDTPELPTEANDWQNNIEWSGYSLISQQGCQESSFYEYGVIYPNNPQESWYDGCPQCNHIYANYAYYGNQPYSPCGIDALAPMYRGIDYIDTTGDGETNEVDIYHWPTGNPYEPELLGTGTPAVLDDGTPCLYFTYTIDTWGSDPNIETYFVFYNWY